MALVNYKPFNYEDDLPAGIRLFQDSSGWTPKYTESGVDEGFEPVCFGRSFAP